ncbi:MAG: DUF2905 domain-containing protein [Candidatus Hydrogenedentota bacterium]
MGIGKIIILIGLALVLLGGIVLLFEKQGIFGHLPGDINIKGKNFTFYFPLTTCILLSIILTLILTIIRKF